MGGGSYSVNLKLRRNVTMSYASKSVNQIFEERSINNAMSPFGVRIREARDSNEHPNSLPIILGLDVTGSMGSIPHYLVKDGLPHIMGKIIQAGIADPQLLFLAIGDHEYDKAPLQVGQFESSDELVDTWLTKIFLEGGGGGNTGESYLLAWYFAAYHTVTDSMEKRKQKGFLFTIGDEPTLKEIPQHFLKSLIGDGQYEDFTAAKLLDKARENYNVYHLHIKQTGAGQRQHTMDGWKQLIQDNLIIVENAEEVAKIIPKIVVENTKSTIIEAGKATMAKVTEVEAML